ncbi:MAG: SpoIVB peptidase S55 domain-containing protein, partial [Traorella sp.]
VLENQNVESIDIKITKKQIQRKPEIKSFEFEIIDQDVLEKTNGIIQGMSGSPIVQNGKLIGAVTHVSSKSPKKGYALYIEWMLNESD